MGINIVFINYQTCTTQLINTVYHLLLTVQTYYSSKLVIIVIVKTINHFDQVIWSVY